MAAHGENYLKRVVYVQDLVLRYKKKGVSAKWVYDNVVYNMPPFISYETFRKYMCMNAKKELLVLNKNKKRK